MAYGSNQPFGLVPIATTTSATWNNQGSPYLIQSGYANNIFVGDLVYQGADGYLHNLSDLQAATYPTAQILGVFLGLHYEALSSVQPINPAGSKKFWQAGTATLNNQDVVALVDDDPTTIYNIQSDATGIPFTAQGSTASVSYTYVAGSTTNATGNTSNGTSNLVLNVGSIGTNAALNLRILRFMQYDQNVPGIPYNNVQVLIQNHSFMQRAAGL